MIQDGEEQTMYSRKLNFTDNGMLNFTEEESNRDKELKMTANVTDLTGEIGSWQEVHVESFGP